MPLTLRQMTAEDVELGMRLKDQAGWNQTPEDWHRFLGLEPEGCFVGQWDGRAVATTTTCLFGPVGWIAMVLVDEPYRHRRIATRLVERALEYLDARGAKTVRLDATRYGRPVYERMGFVAEYDLARMQGTARSVSQESNMSVVAVEQLDGVAELDRRATSTSRGRLLERLVLERPESARLVMNGTSVAGYAILRPGANATQIGPAVALTEPAGRSLGDWALNGCVGQPVFVDIPIPNRPAMDWSAASGLEEQRRFTRMVRGDPTADHTDLLWASSGPEKG